MSVAITKEWPSLEAAQENLNAFLSESRAELARLEAEFGFPSSELEGKVRTGAVSQTAEVCHWFLVLDLVESVASGQSA